MSRNTTEQLNTQADSIDVLGGAQAASLLLDGQIEAVKAVHGSLPNISKAAHAMARTMQTGGNLIYCAAGSSGLMALADGLEIPGTFGIANDRVKILFAGGDACLKDLRGGPEDDETLAILDIEAAQITAADCVIALSASGSTPYAVKCMALANAAGAQTIGIANNENAPLLQLATVPVFLPTPPEIIAGSTRMGAGTAQKVTLNMMSTIMAIELGHVHAGQMVNVVADNEKLKQRACHMVVSIAECSKERALEALNKSGGNVKIACLLAFGAEDQEAAKIILDRSDQKLRSSLNELTKS